jgi:hypothetical protein
MNGCQTVVAGRGAVPAAHAHRGRLLAELEQRWYRIGASRIATPDVLKAVPSAVSF